MTFRNDHDAAITRIDILERDLADAHDQARAKAEHDTRRIAVLEREIADLRRHAPERSRKPSAPAPPRSAPPPATAKLRAIAPMRGPAVSVGAFVVAAVMAMLIAVFAYLALRTNFDPRPRPAVPQHEER